MTNTKSGQSANTNNGIGALIPGLGGKGAIDFAPTSEYIGMAVQEYYSWVNNTTFYNSISPNLKPFYRKVMNWEYWINGLVPDFHDLSKGVIPTHLAKAIVDKVTALIFGGGINYAAIDTDKSGNAKGRNETLDNFDEWAAEASFSSVVQTVIRYATGLGTAAFKLNVDACKRLWIEAAPLSRTKYTLDAKGNPLVVQFYIKTLAHPTKPDSETLGLFEERSYINGVPHCTYKVYRIAVQCNQSQMPSTYLEWESIPAWARKQLKEAFSDIRLDRPIRMPFTHLGVYIYRNTPRLTSMPQLAYGDSVLEGIIKYLCDYDILSSVIDTEMYVSRARVLAKKPYQNPQKANYNSGLDNFLMTYYEEMGQESKPLTFIQPDLRAEQMKSVRNMLLENIATAIGIAPSSFASYLNDSSNRTAREISAEESSTTLLVENKRVGLLYTINRIIDDVRLYYGWADKIQASFSKAGQTNYTLLVENALRIYQAGGSSLEEFVRTVHPDWNEAMITAELEKIRVEQRERQASQMSIFGAMDNETDIRAFDDGREETE
ncbi:MAG: hypothetical protein IJY01_00460 [Clostridia bacterium]|nr:hypothetical protein [Clostridia bacterium]